MPVDGKLLISLDLAASISTGFGRVLGSDMMASIEYEDGGVLSGDSLSASPKKNSLIQAGGDGGWR
jgi:hypothetical protein